MTEPMNPDVRHEDSDVNARTIFASALGLAIVGLGIYAMVWLLFGYFAGREASSTVRQYPLAAGQESRLPPEPRLQTNPRQDLQNLREEEDQILTGYRWVDQNAGVVRIPISEAMRLTVERGLPARQGTGEAKK